MSDIAILEQLNGTGWDRVGQLLRLLEGDCFKNLAQCHS